MINWVFPWSLNTFVKAPAARSSEKKEGEKKETCPLKRMSATWHQIPTLKKQFIKHLARPKTVPAETMHRFKKRMRKKPKNSGQVSKIFTTWTFHFENFQAKFLSQNPFLLRRQFVCSKWRSASIATCQSELSSWRKIYSVLAFT